MAGHGPKHYVKIWAMLLVLLVISIIGPEFGIKIVTLVTAFGIAVVKAYMVAKYFMHVNIERKYVHYILITGISFMLIFYFGVAPDVMRHTGANIESNKLTNTNRWTNYAAQNEIRRKMDQGCKLPEFNDTSLCIDYYAQFKEKPPKVEVPTDHHGESKGHH